MEIAIVIGRKAKYVKEEYSQNFIFGYCICNDISEREWQKNRGGQWVKGKSADTFGPTGPYLVTQDEIPDINNLTSNTIWSCSDNAFEQCLGDKTINIAQNDIFPIEYQEIVFKNFSIMDKVKRPSK